MQGRYMIAWDWGEITLGDVVLGILLGLFIVIGPILYGVVLTMAGNFVLGYWGYNRRLGWASVGVTALAEALLLTALLVWGGGDRVVIIHAACFTFQALSTVALVLRRRHQSIAGPSD